MAATKKKVVSKDDLRRLMKAKTAENKTAEKIQHPLAKYNSIGQIVCSVCNIVIKSGILWNVHLQNKSHKQNASRSQHNADIKRKSTDTASTITTKKPRVTETPSSRSHTQSRAADDPPQLRSCLKGSRVLAEYSSSDESENETVDTGNQVSGLPSDFFDSKTADVPEVAQKPAISEVLPEGFFDDPVMDAKVRQVEYRDKMEDEWDSFQKAMKEETHVSEAIQEDEDEQTILERNIIEIDEQIQNWREINDLQERRELLLQNKHEKMSVSEEENEEGEGEELEEWLDWRRKKAWR